MRSLLEVRRLLRHLLISLSIFLEHLQRIPIFSLAAFIFQISAFLLFVDDGLVGRSIFLGGVEELRAEDTDANGVIAARHATAHDVDLGDTEEGVSGVDGMDRGSIIGHRRGSILSSGILLLELSEFIGEFMDICLSKDCRGAEFARPFDADVDNCFFRDFHGQIDVEKVLHTAATGDLLRHDEFLFGSRAIEIGDSETLHLSLEIHFEILRLGKDFFDSEKFSLKRSHANIFRNPVFIGMFVASIIIGVTEEVAAVVVNRSFVGEFGGCSGLFSMRFSVVVGGIGGGSFGRSEGGSGRFGRA